MQAVSVRERIAVLDVVRGLAIFGILLVNITYYSTSLQSIIWQTKSWSGWNKAAEIAVHVLVEGKFLAVFAFLFGYGMVIFQDRAEAKGRPFGRLFARRLFLLLLFGLVHGLFVWFGDILFHYALLGFVLLLFRKAKPKTLLLWSGLLLALLGVVAWIGGGADLADGDPAYAQFIHETVARDELVYGQGGYGDIQPLRVADWMMSAGNQVVFYPQILAMFLIGAYFARHRWLHDVARHRNVLRNVALFAGMIGWATAALQLAASLGLGGLVGLADRIDAWAVAVGAPVLGLFYVAAFALLFERTKERPVWRPLAAVGRTAFTNYIMQSVVCTLVFYGYGLGWYGQTGPAWNVVLAGGVFALQLVVSSLWMQRFRMGPLEWLWRTGTYGVRTPLRWTKAPASLPEDGR